MQDVQTPPQLFLHFKIRSEDSFFPSTTYDVIMTPSVPNLGHDFSILAMSSTCLPSVNVQFESEVSVLKTTYDVIMTSSVPNLGHVFSILVMTCTCLPSFNVQFESEVSVLKTTYDVIMTSSVPNLGHVFSFSIPSNDLCHVYQGFGGSGDQVRVRGPLLVKTPKIRPTTKDTRRTENVSFGNLIKPTVGRKDFL